MNDTRWRNCLHEAGHAIICIHLGGIVDSVGVGVAGGQCIAGGLSRDSSVYYAAAGPNSEHLADIHPAPESLPPTKPTAEIPLTDGDQNNADHSPIREFADTLSDEQRIASWCVVDHENEPERWLIRYRFVHRIAEQLVLDNTTEIVAVASELFRRGSLSGDDVSIILHSQKTKVA